jgi:hypothetical protein
MLDATKSLLLGGGDQAPVAHQTGGGVGMESIEAQDQQRQRS